MNPTGNVGIGSTNPKALIQISRNGYAAIGLGEDDANVFYMTKETTDNSFNIWRGAFGSSANLLKIAATGNVGIGTSNPQSKLAVNGTITAKEVVVTLNGWSDHVFAADYRLAPLSEVAEHIESKRHLPGIPSEAEILDKGLSMGEMQRLHMAKIEELTLYAIQADKELRISQAKAEANAQLQATTQAEVRRLTQENKIMAERLERIERVLLARDHASEVSP